MKVTSLAVGLIALEAASVLALPATADYKVATVTVTGTDTHLTHKAGRFDKTKPNPTASHTGTHKDGRFDKTKPASTSSLSGTHKAGRFDKTKPASTSSQSGTHKAGRFDKTKPASTSSQTGTHKAGRFDKTKPASTSSQTGTHKAGRFDKTKPATTSTVYVQVSPTLQKNAVFIRDVANASNGTNASISSLSTNAAAQIGGSNYGYALGSAAFVGAAMLLL